MTSKGYPFRVALFAFEQAAEFRAPMSTSVATSAASRGGFLPSRSDGKDRIRHLCELAG
jgi:hypothetical protein